MKGIEMIEMLKPLNVPAVILDQLDVGICLIDHSGCVKTVNAEFKRQAKVYDTFNLLRSGRLCLSSDSDLGGLGFHIRESLQHCGQSDSWCRETIISPKKAGTAILSVVISPVHEPASGNKDGFTGIVLISRDETHPKQIDLDLVKRAYNDITGAELNVIELVVQGLTNAEIAERRCRAVETINSQVKSILEKTQVSNRTQLVHLLGKFLRRVAPTQTFEDEESFVFKQAS